MPDGGCKWQWVVAVAAMVVNMIVFGSVAAGGVVYLAVYANYGGTHAQVAWVVLTLAGVTNLLGPLAAYLGARYSYRVVVMASGVVACFSVLVSCFAHDLTSLTVTYGVLVGFGFSLGASPAIIVVGLYSKRHRAVANGIAMAGAPIGGFLMAPLLEYLFDEYGLRGTFIIMSAIFLNICVCGALFRPLPADKKKSVVTLSSAAAAEKEKMMMIPLTEIKPNKGGGGGGGENDDARRDDKNGFQSVYDDHNHHREPSPPMQYSIKNANGTTFQRDNNQETLLQQQVVKPRRQQWERTSTNIHDNDDDDDENDDDDEGTISNNKDSVGGRFSCCSSYWFLCHGIFLLVTLGWGLLIFALTCFALMSPDFAHTELEGGGKVTKQDAAFLVSCHASGDLVGRLLYGFVVDKKFFPSKFGYMFTMSVAGVASIAAPFATSYSALAFVAVVFGLAIGCTAIQHPLLLVEYLGVAAFKGGYGFLNGFAGIVTLSLTGVVGHLRDRTGSYTANYVMIGSLLLCVALLWTLEPLILRNAANKSQRGKKGQRNNERRQNQPPPLET